VRETSHPLQAKVCLAESLQSATPALPQLHGEDRRAFISNGEGNITVIQENSPTEFVALDPIQMQQGAKTMTFDNKTGKILLSAATVVVAPATDASQKPNKSITEGTFAVLVVGK
jgi:hypothetical protein